MGEGDNRPNKDSTTASSRAPKERHARQAEALRANLRRRKARETARRKSEQAGKVDDDAE